ncbi:hypothetical protein AQ808_26240 [Burkholderia pseudomallei]|nr:hypothetical protein AM256_30865 [Burkholderia pseudomallei]ALC03929.1 hypothetical protein AM257_30905 [Burkholderia pseudomallei]ANW52718.1 hypothetical protein A7U58_21530 [Burkholderia pseudomallei]ANW58699.1 hypothetical protein A7U59_21480 [Burkholderia pseudomallei]OMT59049.1 hypothetical protein AQ760_04975 [Burkholderia pseudomallei]
MERAFGRRSRGRRPLRRGPRERRISPARRACARLRVRFARESARRAARAEPAGGGVRSSLPSPLPLRCGAAWHGVALSE